MVPKVSRWWLFSRGRGTTGAQLSTQSTAGGAPTQFVGFSREPDRGVSAGTGLYEFDTADGVPIYLHDAYCRTLTFSPGGPPTFTLVFEFDPEWVPGQLTDPTFSMLFSDAVILTWAHDGLGPDPAGVPGGQVSEFDWDGARTFTLCLLSEVITFTATKVEVRHSGT